jgi:hypothetical protein
MDKLKAKYGADKVKLSRADEALSGNNNPLAGCSTTSPDRHGFHFVPSDVALHPQPS